MSRFRVLFERLLFRRLLGDGEGVVSIIPPSSITLYLSTIVFALVAQEKTNISLVSLVDLTIHVH